MADSANSCTNTDTSSVSIAPSLLLRATNNDSAAWERLTYLFVPVVLYWCRRAGLQDADAEDVSQEVFRTVHASLGSFHRNKPTDSFRGWLYTITRSRLTDFFRQNKGKAAARGGTEANLRLAELCAESDPSTASSIPPEETNTLFRRTLDLIKGEFEPRTWLAFWLVSVADQTAAQAATQTGLSIGAVYVAKSRVLRRLRDELAEVIELPADT